MINPCNISVKTELTVMPGKTKILSNLSLLTPFMDFTKWASKPSKNTFENSSIRTKSIILKISPIATFSKNFIENGFENENYDVEDENELLDDIYPGFATVTTPGRRKFIIIPRYGCIFLW